MKDDLAISLSKFGVTINQAKIYLAILRLGDTSIEPISNCPMSEGRMSIGHFPSSASWG